MKHTNRILPVIAVALLLPTSTGWAQQNGPALGVARVSLANGDVTLRRGESGDWMQAQVNSPLVEGDSIAAGAGSRAEVQLDYSNLLRLGPDTEVHMANLENRRYRVQVERGVVTYSELRGGEADVDIETPLVAVRPGKNGRYRVEAHGDGEVWVIVRKGEAEIASPEGVEVLKKGKRMIVRAGQEKDGSEFIITNATPRDEWDEWNERRDKSLRKSESYRYVSRSIYGAEDLDDHGHWVYVPRYGNCWFPSVNIGWAPYRYGGWRYIDYYGWTWVSREPWGWAPYHYGRWFHHAIYGWGWYPGAYYGRHYWRPALVAFFGFDFGIGFGVGGYYPYRHVGWVPLAPGERYYPWYGRGSRRVGGGRNAVIVNNNINIHNGFRNARANNGVNVVTAERFARGLASQPRSLRASELRRATVMRGQIPVVPEAQSRGNVVRRATLRPASEQNGSRQFFSTGRPQRPVQRISFQQQREQVTRTIRVFAEANGRRQAASGSSSGTVGRGAQSGTGSAGGGDGRTSSAGGVRSATLGAIRGQRNRASQTDIPSQTGSPTSVPSSTTDTRRSRGVAAFPSATARSRGRNATAIVAAPDAAGGVRSGATTQSGAGGASRPAWRRFGGTTGRARDGFPTTGAPRSTTSTSSREPTSRSRWRTFSRSRTGGSGGATVRSTPNSPKPGDRTFRTTRPQGVDRSSGRPSIVPRTNSRIPSSTARTNSSSSRTRVTRGNSGTFAPRIGSRVNSSSRSNSSSVRRSSGSRSAPPRVDSSRSSSGNSGGFPSRSRSRVPSSSWGGYSSSRSTAPSMPSRGSSMGRSPAPPRAPSVSRSPSRSGGSYGHSRSSAPSSMGRSSSRGSMGSSSGSVRSGGVRSSSSSSSTGSRSRDR